MSDKIIIGIDGVSYSGKTTLCDKIEKRKNIKIISESPKFVNIEMKITNDKNDIINNSKKTLEIEKLRTNSVNNSLDNLYIYDRTIFSFLAISYSYFYCGMIDYFNEYLASIVEGIETGFYLVPDYLIVLDISNMELNLRKNELDKGLPDYWTSDEFNDGYRKILSQIASLYKKNNRLLHSESLHNQETKKFSKISIDLVINFLKGLRK